MRRAQRPGPTAIVGVILLVLYTGPAEAQGDCPELGGTVGHKVVVGDILPASGADALEFDRVARIRVQHALATQVEALRVDSAVEVHHVTCPPGWPGGGREVFVHRVLSDLDSRKVLLGLWGESRPPKVVIDYVLVPLRLRLFQKTGPVGIYAAVHTLDEEADIADLFRNALELGPYLSLALGHKTLEEAQAMHTTDQEGRRAKTKLYDHSRQYFCRAEGLLRAAKAATIESGDSSREWADLLHHAREEVVRTTRLAEADDDYLGLVTVLPEEDRTRCPGLED